MSELGLIPSAPVSAAVVAKLEEALELARAGKLSSVAIAYVDREGYIASGWSEPPSGGHLLGAVAHLQYRLAEALA